MTFLQPILLAALPLISLPIIIHLINQRRYQSIQWAAMMFLLAANRMSRGYAKLRQMLILLFRTLAIAGLIFAVSRPLAGGWIGRATGGRPDTTIVLLDRSPSMQQQGPGTRISKLEAGRHQLARTLGVLGSGSWVLIDSTTNVAAEIESPDALLNSSLRLPGRTRQHLGRSAGHAGSGSRLHSGQQVRAAPRSGSAPTCATTIGTPRASAGRRCAIPSWSFRRASASTCLPIPTSPMAT